MAMAINLTRLVAFGMMFMVGAFVLLLVASYLPEVLAALEVPHLPFDEVSELSTVSALAPLGLLLIAASALEIVGIHNFSLSQPDVGRWVFRSRWSPVGAAVLSAPQAGLVVVGFFLWACYLSTTGATTDDLLLPGWLPAMIGAVSSLGAIIICVAAWRYSGYRILLESDGKTLFCPSATSTRNAQDVGKAVGFAFVPTNKVTFRDLASADSDVCLALVTTEAVVPLEAVTDEVDLRRLERWVLRAICRLKPIMLDSPAPLSMPPTPWQCAPGARIAYKRRARRVKRVFAARLMRALCAMISPSSAKGRRPGGPGQEG